MTPHHSLTSQFCDEEAGRTDSPICDDEVDRVDPVLLGSFADTILEARDSDTTRTPPSALPRPPPSPQTRTPPSPVIILADMHVEWRLFIINTRLIRAI